MDRERAVFVRDERSERGPRRCWARSKTGEEKRFVAQRSLIAQRATVPEAETQLFDSHYLNPAPAAPTLPSWERRQILINSASKGRS